MVVLKRFRKLSQPFLVDDVDTLPGRTGTEPGNRGLKHVDVLWPES